MNLARCLGNALENVEKTFKIDELNRIIENNNKIYRNLKFVHKYIDMEYEMRERKNAEKLRICGTLSRLSEYITNLAVRYSGVLRSMIDMPKMHIFDMDATAICEEEEKKILERKYEDIEHYGPKRIDETVNMQKTFQDQKVSMLLHNLCNSIDITRRMLNIHESSNQERMRTCKDFCHSKLSTIKMLIEQGEEKTRNHDRGSVNAMELNRSDDKFEEKKGVFTDGVEKCECDRIEVGESLKGLGVCKNGQKDGTKNMKLLLRDKELEVRGSLLSLQQKMVDIEAALSGRIIDRVLLVLSQGSLENDLRFAGLMDETLKDMEGFDSPDITRMSVQFVIAKKYVEDMIALKGDSILRKHLEKG